MKDKQIGLLIALIGVLVIAFTYSIVPIIQDAQMTECSCGGDGESLSCPHASQFPSQMYLGIGLAIVLFYASYTLIPKKSETKKKITIPKDLNTEEREVINEIIKSDGMIFQSEIVENLKFSKVKVTRILDKLEARKLIERRRRGMTNAVILK